MAGIFPRFRLYNSTGLSLLYEFDNVLDWGDGILLDPITFSKHESLRGRGSIISEGSLRDWELPLEFLLTGTDYEDLMIQKQFVNNSIVKNTKYILKVDLTEVGGTKDLKVKRLNSIRFPVTNDKSKVVRFQKGFITFLVDCWA